MNTNVATRRVVRLVFVLVALAITGEAAHMVFDQVNAVVAHHFFHIVFPLAAFLVFAALVARDVRAHGWPRFSWRLAPAEQVAPSHDRG